MLKRIAIFGESETGKYSFPYLCNSLYQLADTLGNPPKDSLGLILAIQALMYEREVIFFRVKEEGFSFDDYIEGCKYLKNKKNINYLDAICTPKVGCSKIINETFLICKIHQSIMIISEKDFFDYLLQN